MLPRILCIAGAVALLAPDAVAQKLAPWDLIDTAQAGQKTIYLANPGGGYCGVPVELADYDDDGFIDYAVAPGLADSGPGATRMDSGEVIVFAGDGSISGVMDLANPPPGQPLLRVLGGAAFDYLGTEIFTAEVTGDGIKDLIIGASGADPNGRATAGSVFIIPGGPSFGGVIDLASPPSSIIWIQGADATDRCGLWVEAGDVDGDGLEDLLFSADDADGVNNANTDRGEVYVIYGGQALPPVIDMASPPAGLQITTIYGDDNGDRLGSCIHAVDLDGDGIEEIVVSAALNRAIAGNTGGGISGGDGPTNSRSNCGDSYVVWGSAALPATINLATETASLLAANALTVVYGANSNDFLGEELTSGNFDGDAWNDLVLGAITADGFANATPSAGDGVVLWGGPQLRGQVFDMALLPSGTTVIYGEDPGDILADTLSGADVNDDGFTDLFVALPNADPVRNGNAVSNAGELIILFGGPVRWPAEIQASLLDADTRLPSRRVIGADSGDLMGYSMEGGDVDADGYDDLFPNAMRGDGFGNALVDAGEVTITSGRLFSRGIVTLGAVPAIGTAAVFNLRGEPGFLYAAAFSGALAPAQPLPGGTLHLAADPLFQLSLMAPAPLFIGTSGTISVDGKASYALSIPPLAFLVGLELHTAFVTIDTTVPTLATISATTSFVIE